MQKFFLVLISFFLISCTGGKVSVKPEKISEGNIPKDTLQTEPKKIFSEQFHEESTDTVVIPKRTKQDKIPQIIIAPIILPITALPAQIQEQKTEPEIKKLETKKEPEPKPQTPPPKPEIKEKKIEPPKLEIKPVEPQKIHNFFIQIGAFVTENSAIEQSQKFQKIYPSKNVHIFFDSTSGFYKVQINGVRDSTELLQILSSIQENFPDAFITSNILIQVKEQPQKQNINFQPEQSQIKIQLGAYTKISKAMEIKNYVETKFKVKSDVIEDGKLFKVVAFVEGKDEMTLNEIKSEFPDAFLIK
jgi:hypothetical protein